MSVLPTLKKNSNTWQTCRGTGGLKVSVGHHRVVVLTEAVFENLSGLSVVHRNANNCRSAEKLLLMEKTEIYSGKANAHLSELLHLTLRSFTF